MKIKDIMNPREYPYDMLWEILKAGDWSPKDHYLGYGDTPITEEERDAIEKELEYRDRIRKNAMPRDPSAREGLSTYDWISRRGD